MLRGLIVVAVALTFVACLEPDDSRDTPATEIVTEGELSVRTPDTDFTPPSIPTTDPQRLVPTALMFCEPVTQGEGEEVTVATVPTGFRVIYSNGCHSNVDADGTVFVREETGGASRIAMDYLPFSHSLAESIVWRPATGELAGQSVVMVGKYLSPNASVEPDSFGEPYAILNLNEDGRQVFASLSERIINRPLATFVSGQPLRRASGEILAPIVLAGIDDTIVLQGLSAEDAVFLRDLVNSGNAN